MKKFILILMLLLINTTQVFAFTTWENSPNNWNNSINNWQNSPNNWVNSPNNWNNSINNPNANIIYDSNGNARGYAVPKSNGTGMNLYDFNGNRNGYYNY
ncbi:tat pathway signal sequence [Brachyspira sp. CAG:484]|nr:tat pathway signal sequence [Brachyspira sp. CAG:484]